MTKKIEGAVIDSAVYSRVAKAADQIFANTEDKAKMPKVDEVRRLAAVSMNDASNGMKIWRKRKLREAEPAPVSVPESVMQRFVSSLGEAWKEAQKLANESLQAAQKSWDLERDELEDQRISMAESFDTQAQEFAEYKNAALKAEKKAEQDAVIATQQVYEAKSETKALHDDLLQAQAQATQSEIRAVEIEKRANDLRIELERSRSQSDELQGELKDAARQLEQVRSELSSMINRLSESEAKREAEANTHSEQYHRVVSAIEDVREERDKERKAAVDAQNVASVAREKAAELKGQLTGAEQQINELLKRLPPINIDKK